MEEAVQDIPEETVFQQKVSEEEDFEDDEEKETTKDERVEDCDTSILLNPKNNIGTAKQLKIKY